MINLILGSMGIILIVVVVLLVVVWFFAAVFAWSFIKETFKKIFK